jgi:hypothetical protein
MKRLPENIDSTAEDGHPCEAALEFRRAAIRSGIVREISADALDLATSFAWIGKAISRSGAVSKWKLSNIDPNTHEFIRALAFSDQLRRTAAADAVASTALSGREFELKEIRELLGFKNALATLAQLTSTRPSRGNIMRLGELHSLAQRLPGKHVKKVSTQSSDNVVLFPLANRRPKKKAEKS